MATVTKNPDGDLSLGNLRAEIVTLQPAASDYVTGGYLIEGVGASTITTGNIGIDKVLGVVCLGGMQGYKGDYDLATNKWKVYDIPFAATTPTAPEPQAEVAAGTDLSALTITLLVIGI